MSGCHEKITTCCTFFIFFQVSIFCRISGFDEFDEAPPPGIQAVAFVVFTLLHCYMIFFFPKESPTLDVSLTENLFGFFHCRLQQ